MTTGPEDSILPEGAAVLFVNSGGQVLLRLRDSLPDLPFGGMWDVIGGAVEADETPQQAAREVAEEIGIKLSIHHFFGDFMGVVVNHVFVAPLNTPAELLILTEGERLGWFDLKGALDLALVPWVLGTLEKVPLV